MKKKRHIILNLIEALIVGIAIVGFWRGIWGLMDIYLFPNNHLLSLITSALLGFLILILTKNFIRTMLE